MKDRIRLGTAVLAALFLAFSGTAQAERVAQKPSALAMTGDALIARPLLIATTIGGSAVYVVSLPFSYLGGNANEAREVLVEGPYRATFHRCLGCTSGTAGSRSRKYD